VHVAERNEVFVSDPIAARRVASVGRGASLRDAIESALEGEPRAVQRLTHARTSLRFEEIDDPGNKVTLLLDRRPPQVGADDDPVEVRIQLTHRQAEEFVRGTLALPAAIMAGEVACSGPLRKYLPIDPVLRGLLEAGA
jgi:hypothetical protein